MNSSVPYNGSLTREQFLFYEMRTTAKLKAEGLSDKEIVERICSENLFQYPTERTIKRAVNVCLKRLAALNDAELTGALANAPSNVGKQICLYAMIRQYRIVYDFMVTVIGEKYRQQDFSYSRAEINAFFMRLQEQDDVVASWSESTIKKIVSVLGNLLVENEYIDSPRATKLNPVLIESQVENAIRANGDEAVLPAFNCFD